MVKKYLLFSVFLMVLPVTASGYDLYVKSVKAPVFTMPDAASTVLATCRKGTKLAGVENKGNWHMIRMSDNRTGWVYRFLVGKTPPMRPDDTEALINQYQDHSTRARRRPSSYTAAAAARGLREKRRRFAEKYNLDYKTLEKIEAIKISEAELMSFIKQEKINENRH